jgi:hypothetical protein
MRPVAVVVGPTPWACFPPRRFSRPPYPGAVQELQPCGTWAAYKRHRKLGQTVDPACAQAAREQGRSLFCARCGKAIQRGPGRAPDPMCPPAERC